MLICTRSVRVTRPSITLTAAACALLALAGCSSAKFTPASKVPSASTVSATPAPTVAPTPAKVFTTSDLKKLLLQQTDLPTGWTGASASDDGSDDSGTDDQAGLISCIGGGVDNSGDELSNVSSDDYSKGADGAATISSSATSYKSVDDVKADIAIFQSPKINECLGTVLKQGMAEGMPAGSSIGAVSFAFTPRAASDPQNLIGVARGSIKVTASGQKISVHIDTAFIASGSLETEIDFENVNAPIDTALETQLIAVVAGRTAQA